MPIDRQDKNAVILAAKKSLELVEFRLKDLEREFMGLRKLIDQLSVDREPAVQETQPHEPMVQEPQHREPTVQVTQHREPTIQEPQQKEPVKQEPQQREPTIEKPQDREPIVPEPQKREPVNREPIPVKISEKPKSKKKKELDPEPVSPPKSQTLLNLEKIFPEIESGSMHPEIQRPKRHKTGIDPEIQLDGVELRFLKMISSQEENEHKLPVIAGQLNLPIARVRDVVTRLLGIGLLYSPNPNDSNAEFYIDQKGLEALAKKKLL